MYWHNGLEASTEDGERYSWVLSAGVLCSVPRVIASGAERRGSSSHAEQPSPLQTGGRPGTIATPSHTSVESLPFSEARDTSGDVEEGARNMLHGEKESSQDDSAKEWGLPWPDILAEKELAVKPYPLANDEDHSNLRIIRSNVVSPV